MPRKKCFWTRKLELDLVDFVKRREYIWKPVGNTNHDIKMKYKAYAEFAALLDQGFTARSVRDRWVNIRSTFHHYQRRLEKSKLQAESPDKVYVPSWPLFKPLQFLLSKKENGNHSFDGYPATAEDHQDTAQQNVKDEIPSDFEDKDTLAIRQRSQRTDRPRTRKSCPTKPKRKSSKCKMVLDDLVTALRPLKDATSSEESHSRSYWFLGKHVTERLNRMRPEIAESAGKEILWLLEDWRQETKPEPSTP